jgi:hypothetical protein
MTIKDARTGLLLLVRQVANLGFWLPETVYADDSALNTGGLYVFRPIRHRQLEDMWRAGQHGGHLSGYSYRDWDSPTATGFLDRRLGMNFPAEPMAHLVDMISAGVIAPVFVP